MNSTEIERLVWLSETRDVVVLHWPDEAEAAAETARQGLPRLLLVRPDTPPPMSESCLEDWLLLPATDVEIQTRLINLARRAARHSHPPTVDDLGQVTHRGRSVFLSPTDQRVMQALVEKFGAIVTEPELINRVWPDGATNQVLRAHVSRLRHRLLPIDLTIKCVRNAGYFIAEANAS
jgi:DNA-binding response OmpR family regulator